MRSKIKGKTEKTGWWHDVPTVLRVDMHGLYDGNGDGLGDFRGAVEKIPFLIDIGFSGLRFQQVCFYGDDYQWAGLVNQNWFDVDPRYGTMDEFHYMMASCKANGIKIIEMAVPEYLGWDHPDYLAARDAVMENRDDPRRSWFIWKNDKTVLTCWDRPGTNTSDPGYIDMYIRYINYWMDKGIAGFDTDAVTTWLNLDLDSLTRINDAITDRGGFVCPEGSLLENQVLRKARFNAGSGKTRDKLYFEAEAIMDENAEHIGKGLAQRKELLHLGVFPYQEFGEKSRKLFKGDCYGLEMFKLQAAFNAVIPDQLWVHSCALTYDEPSCTYDQPYNPYYTEARINWQEIERQEVNPSSPWSHVKKMLRLRKQYKALGIGDSIEVGTNSISAYAAVRTTHQPDERALVVFNLRRGEQEIAVDLSGTGVQAVRNILSGDETRVSGGKLTVKLPLYGYAFYEIT